MSDTIFVADVPHVFLVVPFGDGHDAAQQAMRAAAASLGLACYRADDIRRSTAIVDRVLQGVRSATVVVADLTGNRPNCYYELGHADALRRPVILLQRADTEAGPAFDVSGRSICRYRDARHLEEELPKWLREAVLVNHTRSTIDDKNAGRYGRLAIRDDYLLAAHVELGNPGEDEKRGWVTASVRRVDGKALPTNAKVSFFLDESASPNELRGDIVNGVARCAFKCDSAFSLGARLAGISLELDLRHIPGAGDSFRSL